MSKADIKAVIDFLCASGLRQAVHFLWRPRLADVRDDMVLEAAVNGACQWLVTHNLRDFSPAAGMGIRVLTPGQALESLKE